MSARDLEVLRFELDLLDDQIVDLLLGRFRRLERVAAVKAAGDLPAHDPVREKAIADRLAKRLTTATPAVRDAIADIMSTVVLQGRLEVKRCAHTLTIARHDGCDGTMVGDGADRARARGEER